jgi:YD repeat-containing protein
VNAHGVVSCKVVIVALTYLIRIRSKKHEIPAAQKTAFLRQSSPKTHQEIYAVGIAFVHRIQSTAAPPQPTRTATRNTFTYDAANRLTQATDSIAGTITRAYDGLNRMTQEATPVATLNYSYDAAGRRTQMTVTDQTATTYTWENASRLIAMDLDLPQVRVRLCVK